MNIKPIAKASSVAIATIKKASGLDKTNDKCASIIGKKIYEGVIDSLNSTDSKTLITSGYDGNGKLAIALNNRPELHYHNTFNFYISAADADSEADVERMIHRIVASVPSK
jgi:hypothetical protein